jgi:hypothetical protein
VRGRGPGRPGAPPPPPPRSAVIVIGGTVVAVILAFSLVNAIDKIPISESPPAPWEPQRGAAPRPGPNPARRNPAAAPAPLRRP